VLRITDGMRAFVKQHPHKSTPTVGCRTDLSSEFGGLFIENGGR
jgi:hypothetical protein